MNDQTLLSIVIPTYSPGNQIVKTIESFVSILEKNNEYHNLINIIVTDDASRDSVSKSALDVISKKYSKWVLLKRNKQNKGMDENTKQAVLNSSSPFVWIVGQDDELIFDTLDDIIRILQEEPKLGLMFLNYQQLDEKVGRISCDSFLTTYAINEKIQARTVNENILYYKDPIAYFDDFFNLPSFMSAIITRRDYYEDEQLKAIIGMSFTHYGLLLKNLNSAPIVIITIPCIKACIPKNGWQANGTKFFSIMLGHLETTNYMFQTGASCLPTSRFNEIRMRFVKNWHKLLILTLVKNGKISNEKIRKCVNIFSDLRILMIYILVTGYLASTLSKITFYVRNQ